ncbi:hypothetical protein H8356DRAFT_1341974 [Neocallimastix lanati (nom. inval.)]|nr:hypothetical protein H8356DRAFT_1341974 [Neocallimastix sp. JGI-2020a]
MLNVAANKGYCGTIKTYCGSSCQKEIQLKYRNQVPSTILRLSSAYQNFSMKPLIRTCLENDNFQWDGLTSILSVWISWDVENSKIKDQGRIDRIILLNNDYEDETKLL